VTAMEMPVPTVIRLEGHRPSAKSVSTGSACSDQIISRPLGYRVKALTLVAPGSLYKTTQNTDSVYIDIEDINFSTGGTPQPNGGPFELPAGTALTLEEIDPGWIHYGSPTANQTLLVTYGGPTVGTKVAQG
jgi:hypothetical protein